MKKQREALIICGVLVLLAAAMLTLYTFARPARQVEEDAVKNVTIEVVHGDGTINTFTYETNEVNLWDLLQSQGLAEGEDDPFGFYVTYVDGEELFYEVDKRYWALYEGETYIFDDIDTIALEDGDSFSLVCTQGDV